MKIKTNLISRASATLGRKQLIAIAVLIMLGTIGGVAIMSSGSTRSEVQEAHEHDETKEQGSGEHQEESAKGPHGGQLLSAGGFEMEVLLSAQGGEPRLRLWLFQKERSIVVNAAQTTAELIRPGGVTQKLTFTADKDTLISTQVIEEPHVFEAAIAIQTSKEALIFQFNQKEGLIAMTDAQVKTAGVTLDTTGPATIRSTLQLPGEIGFNEDRTAHVVPRVAGVVEGVPVALGQQVRKGQLLAVISSPAISEQRAELQAAQMRQKLARTTYEREKKLWEEKISPQQDVLQAEQALHETEIAVANVRQKLQAVGADASSSGTLNRFELRAPFDGTIVEKHIALGEQVREDASVFTIADLRTVWAQINVPAKDLPLVRVGEKVTIRATSFEQTATGIVAYVGSLIGEQTRTAQARVTVKNPQATWRPGLFVNVELTSSEATLPVTVASDAIQTIENKTVVFLRTSSGFVAQPVQVGRSDGKRVEIVKGLASGARYASSGSFVIKAEAGKASVSHTD